MRWWLSCLLLAGCTGGDAVSDAAMVDDAVLGDSASLDGDRADAAVDGSVSDGPASDAAGADAVPGAAYVWARACSGFANCVAKDVATDATGNVIVVGEVYGGFVGFGGAFVEIGQDSDVFVAKYSAVGEHLWSRVYGGRSRDEIYGMAVRPDGRVVIVGLFEETTTYGSFTFTGLAGDFDGVIVELAADGAVRWARALASDSYGYYADVALDASGGIVVGGALAGSTVFAGVTYDLSAPEQGIVAYYSAAGDEVWLRPLGMGVVVDAVDAATSATISGYFFGMVDLGGGPITSSGDGSPPNGDAYLAGYGLDGTFQWALPIQAIGLQRAVVIDSDASGDVFVGGQFQGVVDFGDGLDRTSLTDRDIFLARYDVVSRALVWVRTYYGGADVLALTSKPTGGFAVSGGLQAPTDLGSGTLSPTGSSDVFMAAFTDDGTPVGSVSYGGPNSDIPRGVAHGAGGSYVMGGQFEIDFGPPAQNVFVASLGPTPWLGAVPSPPAPPDAGAPDAPLGASGITHTLTVAFVGDGPGTVTGVPGLTCDAAGCSGTFPAEARLELVATPTSPAGFGGWAGDCRGLGECVLSMAADRAVVAGFTIPFARQFGAARIDEVDSLARDGTGAVAVSGRFGGTVSLGGADLTSVETHDGFLARYDADGVHLWSKRLGGSAPPYTIYPYATGANASGDVTVNGVFQQTIDLGGGALTAAGDEAIYLARFAPNGSHVWSRVLTRTNGSVLSPHRVHVDGAGVVIVHVTMRGTAEFGGGPVTEADFVDYLLAYSGSTGPPVWSRRLPLTYATTALDPADEIVIAGTFYMSIDVGGSTVTTPANAVLTARYDSGTGALQHAEAAATGYGHVTSISSRGGRVAIGGILESPLDFGSIHLQPYYAQVGHVAVLDALDGTALWARRLFSSDLSLPVIVDLDADGNTWAAGNFGMRGWFGGELFTSLGQHDPFVAWFGPSGEHYASRVFPSASYQESLVALVAGDRLGGAYIGGFFGSTLDLGSVVLTSAGDLDAFFARVLP